MGNNFLAIQEEYLKKAWSRGPEELEAALPARRREGCYHFQALGEPCLLCPQEISLSSQRVTGPEGILIALYAASVSGEEPILDSMKSFKELPDSGPYQGAFSIHSERSLLPYVEKIQSRQSALIARFSGRIDPRPVSGDFSFILYPLPRIPLHYIFYLPDEEFPASVTCLFSANAARFMPVAGLADVAEYTAKRMVDWIRNP